MTPSAERMPLEPLPIDPPNIVARFGIPGGGGVEVFKVHQTEMSPRHQPAALGTVVLFTDHMIRDDGLDTPIDSEDYLAMGLQEGKDGLMVQADYDAQASGPREAGQRLESHLVHFHPGYAPRTDSPSFPLAGVIYVDRGDAAGAGHTDTELIAALNQEIKALDAWVCGDVFLLVREEENGDKTGGYAFGSWQEELHAWGLEPLGYEDEAEIDTPGAQISYPGQ